MKSMDISRCRINVSRPYDVIIGSGIIHNIVDYADFGALDCKVAIITDDIVESLHMSILVDILKHSGISVITYAIKHGEDSKSMEVLEELLEWLADSRLTDRDYIFALGGGVVGDIAGLCAGMYKRGIGYVQIPTTFLSAIDSSVGGKTAVNLKAGKNLVGMFNQPRLVVCDIDFMDTLSDDVFLDGVGEAIKYGVIDGEALYSKVNQGIYRADAVSLQEIIYKCISIKASIVAEDELDKGIRKLLNLGHTIGHAIEICSQYSISHGKAVAIGMTMMAKASESLDIGKMGLYNKIKTTLVNNGLDYSCNIDAEELYEVTLMDKKVTGEYIDIVLPVDIGDCCIQRIKVNELLDIIRLGKS